MTTTRTIPAWLGVAVGAAGSALMGSAAIFARIAYDGGVDTVSLLAIRFVVMAAVMFAVARALGPSLRLPRRLWPGVAAVGVAFALSTYGYIGAIAYIPVSLSVPIIYTYPLMVAAIGRVATGEPFGAARWFAALTAFAGVAVMLGVSFEGLDGRGVALAFLGAVSFALATVGGARLMRRIPVPLLIAYMSAVAAFGFVSAGLATGGVSPPETTLGWIGTAGVTGSFLLGFLGFFISVRVVGETRGAVISNIEPVASVLGAIAILGETLTPTVAAGALMVLGGIFLLLAADARNRRAAGRESGSAPPDIATR